MAPLVPRDLALSAANVNKAICLIFDFNNPVERARLWGRAAAFPRLDHFHLQQFGTPHKGQLLSDANKPVRFLHPLSLSVPGQPDFPR